MGSADWWTDQQSTACVVISATTAAATERRSHSDDVSLSAAQSAHRVDRLQIQAFEFHSSDHVFVSAK